MKLATSLTLSSIFAATSRSPPSQIRRDGESSNMDSSVPCRTSAASRRAPRQCVRNRSASERRPRFCPPPVGRKIKAVRGKKGLTQDQLAELAGLNRVHLYRIE